MIVLGGTKRLTPASKPNMEEIPDIVYQRLREGFDLIRWEQGDGTSAAVSFTDTGLVL